MALDESITDLTVAFKVYLEYKKEYIKTFIVFLTGIIVLVFSGMLILRFVILDNYFQFDELIRSILMLIILLILCSIFFLLLSYARTTFGLTYDIMTSGELFTEFRRSITYFKRFWLYFVLLSLPYVLIIVLDQLFTIFILLELIQSTEDNRIFLVPIKIAVYLFDLMLYITLIEIFPSIIVVKKIRQCIIENMIILRQSLKRLFFSVGIYYLVFRGPMFIVEITRILMVTNETTFLFFNIIFAIFAFIYALIGLPILSLISTRIYNTTILKTKAEESESRG
ncbi:MAG: hypothetical protein JSV04_01725 [Candidatus Heimdallarchaeota archaeon]|nr:MAG: hypothetical protein JSV04_01725 [Candidatus Heimdallarchaeota archaeon]